MKHKYLKDQLVQFSIASIATVMILMVASISINTQVKETAQSKIKVNSNQKKTILITTNN